MTSERSGGWFHYVLSRVHPYYSQPESAPVKNGAPVLIQEQWRIDYHASCGAQCRHKIREQISQLSRIEAVLSRTLTECTGEGPIQEGCLIVEAIAGPKEKEKAS